jgi:hypothetical protein
MRCAETEKRMAAFFASELQRAATDVGRFREAYKEETRRNEKLYRSLEAEKAACQTAEADIQELRQLLSRAQGAGLLTAAIGGEAAPHVQPVSSASVTTPAPVARAGGAVTLAARASFGAPGGLQRTSSGSAHPPSQGTSVYGSPSNNSATTGSSSRRLMALGGGGGAGQMLGAVASSGPVPAPRQQPARAAGAPPAPLSSSLPTPTSLTAAAAVQPTATGTMGAAAAVLEAGGLAAAAEVDT